MNKEFKTKFQEYYDFYRINLNSPRRGLREDIKHIPLALDNGWEVVEGRYFGDCNHFKKGNKVIWFCRRGWAVADLIDNLYTDHRYYPHLDEVLVFEG